MKTGMGKKSSRLLNGDGNEKAFPGEEQTRCHPYVADHVLTLFSCSALPNCGDLHKNNLLWKKNTRNDPPGKLFPPLTLLCGVLVKGATPIYVAPVGAVPHIVS
jgi:hypothetical protein